MNNVIDKIKSSINSEEKPINLKIFKFTKIINPEYVFIGNNVIIDDFCLLYAKLEMPIKIGSWVHITSFTSLTGGFITIGDFVGISGGCRILGGSEDFKNGALMNPPIPEKYRRVNRQGCKLENFSFIGANSCIFPGVTIGEGVVVGAGSIVRENLEPWGIYIMRNGKMVKIKTRDKVKTYENTKRFLNESKDLRILKIFLKND